MTLHWAGADQCLSCGYVAGALWVVHRSVLGMQVFSQRQKGQLDVYGLWGVLRGQLLTDDSFVFNKVLNRIKESIQHLSDAAEEDEDALLRVKVSAVGRQPGLLWSTQGACRLVIIEGALHLFIEMHHGTDGCLCIRGVFHSREGLC